VSDPNLPSVTPGPAAARSESASAFRNSSSAVRSYRRPLIWAAAFTLWLGSAGTGLFWLMAYDNTPGAIADAPASWPAESALTRDPAAPTLVMLAHPRCDCTRASLGELEELLARVKVKPRTFVVFIKPGGVGSGWEQSGTWERAQQIPGVTVVRDDDGAEARRFGVHTSGQTLLYDAGGQLLYSGGTTGSRGKSGDNAGRADLVALVDGARRPRATRPVFGCPLFSSTSMSTSLPTTTLLSEPRPPAERRGARA
jgi:hypothetical protein